VLTGYEFVIGRHVSTTEEIPVIKFYITKICCTGCSRKNSPIWEANKFETKEDTANVLFFISGKYTECRFTLTCFEQNVTSSGGLEY
jgi:hypothetical protein